MSRSHIKNRRNVHAVDERISVLLVAGWNYQPVYGNYVLPVQKAAGQALSVDSAAADRPRSNGCCRGNHGSDVQA
ncbi:hypothetical protein D3C71_1679130 [compost metagenome]